MSQLYREYNIVEDTAASKYPYFTYNILKVVINPKIDLPQIIMKTVKRAMLLANDIPRNDTNIRSPPAMTGLRAPCLSVIMFTMGTESAKNIGSKTL